jgi:hypothetical protein
VSIAGRQRVLKQRRRNVHAFVEGEWIRRDSDKNLRDWKWSGLVSYNPYRDAAFKLRATGTARRARRIERADAIIFHDHPETMCSAWSISE